MQSANIAYVAKLDHLRFLAAFMVLMFHSNILYNSPDNVHIPALDHGYIGVSLFMVISGFILTLITYGKDIDIGRFYVNRVLRIYPLFVVVVSLGYFATPDPRGTSVGIDYLMALLPISNLYRLNYGAFGGQLWSVMVEMQFYLLFPILALTLKSRGLKFYAAVIVFTIALRSVVFLLTGGIYQSAYFSLLGSMDIFVVGCVAGIVYKKTRDAVVGWYWWIIALCAVNAITYAVHAGLPQLNDGAFWIIWPFLQATMWAVVILTYVKSDARIPFSPALSYLGKISYSIYAWHVVSILLARLLVPDLFNVSPYLAGCVLVLPITVIIAALSYHVIETPFLALRFRYT